MPDVWFRVPAMSLLEFYERPSVEQESFFRNFKESLRDTPEKREELLDEWLSYFTVASIRNCYFRGMYE